LQNITVLKKGKKTKTAVNKKWH